MPRINPEHDARLCFRLPEGMLRALRWTAEYDRLPLSDWTRIELNKRCFGITKHQLPNLEVLYVTQRRRRWAVDGRPLTNQAMHWHGERTDAPNDRQYVDGDGNRLDGHYDSKRIIAKDDQDFFMERAEARRELRTWLNRWTRKGRRRRSCPMKYGPRNGS